MSFIPIAIWKASPMTTNGNEQAHRNINQDGINLTLLAGIMHGYEYDVHATSSIDLHIIHRINTCNNESTHLHRAKCTVSQQSKLELKVLHGVLTQPIVRSQKQQIKSYSQSTNQPNSPANNNLQLPFICPYPPSRSTKITSCRGPTPKTKVYHCQRTAH